MSKTEKCDVCQSEIRTTTYDEIKPFNMCSECEREWNRFLEDKKPELLMEYVCCRQWQFNLNKPKCPRPQCESENVSVCKFLSDKVDMVCRECGEHFYHKLKKQ